MRVELSGAPVLTATVNGNRQAASRLSDKGDWFLRYYGTDRREGVDLLLEVEPSPALTLMVTDQSDGLPELPGGPPLSASSGHDSFRHGTGVHALSRYNLGEHSLYYRE